MTDSPATYNAHVDPEPDGVDAVIDRHGYVWQKISTSDGPRWVSRHKRQGLLASVDAQVIWKVLLIDYGPVVVIQLPATPEART